MSLKRKVTVGRWRVGNAGSKTEPTPERDSSEPAGVASTVTGVRRSVHVSPLFSPVSAPHLSNWWSVSTTAGWQKVWGAPEAPPLCSFLYQCWTVLDLLCDTVPSLFLWKQHGLHLLTARRRRPTTVYWNDYDQDAVCRASQTHVSWCPCIWC